MVFLEDINKAISLSEFERYFKKPHQTIRIHLQNLVDAKILIEDKRERFIFYKINLNNPLTYEYISICEKQRLFDFLEKEIFNRLYLEMSNYFNHAKILLFGSVVNNKDYADIDMLIIADNKEISKTLKKFELTYFVKIHSVITSEKNLTRTFVKELQKKHIIFNSHEYFVRKLYS